MFLTPHTITDFGKNIIVLPESVIYDEVKNINNEKIRDYISELFKKFGNEINQATYYQVILWASGNHLNADVWSFDLKSWDYNTDIGVQNFVGMEIDKNTSIITNKDGFLLLAENEKNRARHSNIEDFIRSFSNEPSIKVYK